MHYDLIIVGAGPIGATLALRLLGSPHRIRIVDARAAGDLGRADRTLALSHGSRLIFERLGIWESLVNHVVAPTPITAIDISQHGGFGRAELHANELDLPALGYVVSYRALQQALDRALASMDIDVAYATSVARVSSTKGYATVETVSGEIFTARLASVADGSGEALARFRRVKHDYRQSALVAYVQASEMKAGLAFERFTNEGPTALLPYGNEYALVWTAAPSVAQTLLALDDSSFLRALQQHFGNQVGSFTSVRERRLFPLSLQYATTVTQPRVVALGNAAQALHPVAGQGFNLGLRDAWELASMLLDCASEEIGDASLLQRYARKRRPDRIMAIAFTHSLLRLFQLPDRFFSLPRGMGLTAFDGLPILKRAFSKMMLHGLH